MTWAGDFKVPGHHNSEYSLFLGSSHFPSLSGWQIQANNDVTKLLQNKNQRPHVSLLQGSIPFVKLCMTVA